LLEHHRLFKQGRVSLAKRKSLTADDRRNFTSLVSMYQATDLYLMEGKRSYWTGFKTIRPSNETVIKDFVKRANFFWDSLVKAAPQLKKVQQLGSDNPLPRAYRNDETGGDFLFRPIAPPIIATCL